MLRPLQQHNPVHRARANAAHHYDLSDRLYELFLDADRQYSCAYFTRPGETLEAAQENKKRHIAAKLLLERNMRVLDIGSGWGGLALYLAASAGAEDPRAAAIRELKEEIGTDRAEILAESKGWLHYDLPTELIAKARHGLWRGQRQKWFVMRFTGDDSEINLEAQHPEFSAWKWVPIEELPDLVVSFRRQVYLAVLAEYRELTRGLSHSLSELLADPIVHMRMAADGVSETELYDLCYGGFRRACISTGIMNSNDRGRAGRTK